MTFPKQAHRSAERSFARRQLHDACIAQKCQNGTFDIDAPFTSADTHLVTVQPSVVTRCGNAHVVSAWVVQVAFQE